MTQNVSLYLSLCPFFNSSRPGSNLVEDVVSISCCLRMDECVMISNSDAAPVRAALAAPLVEG